MKLDCEVYRSPRKEGLYLYVINERALEDIPETLRQQFGTPELAMTLELAPTRKLARADVLKVMEALQTQGYYLQVPPMPGSEMVSIANKNSKLY